MGASAIIWKSYCDSFCLWSSRSEVVTVLKSLKVSRKSESPKLPGKRPWRSIFLILGNKKQSTTNDFLDIFSSDYLLRFTGKAAV